MAKRKSAIVPILFVTTVASVRHPTSLGPSGRKSKNQNSPENWGVIRRILTLAGDLVLVTFNQTCSANRQKMRIGWTSESESPSLGFLLRRKTTRAPVAI